MTRRPVDIEGSRPKVHKEPPRNEVEIPILA